MRSTNPFDHSSDPADQPNPLRTTLSRRGMLALTGASALAVAGCAGGGESAGVVSVYTDNKNLTDPIQAAGNLMKRTVGINLSSQQLPSTTSYQQVIKASLRTKKTPDIVKWWSGYRLQDIARTGGMADLTDVWNTAEQTGMINKSLRPAFSYNNRVYGLPLHESYWVMFYSPKTFAKYGVKPPRTWADMMAAAATFAQHKVTPFHGSVDARWPSFIWFQEIVSRLDPDFYERLMNNRAKYTDPTAVQAMRVWKSMIDRKWFTALDLSVDDGIGQLKQGKLAMLPFGTHGNYTFVKQGMRPGVDYDAFITPPMTAQTPRSVIFESGVLMAPLKAPHHQQAMEVMRNWLRPDVQRLVSGMIADGSANPTVPPPNVILAKSRQQVKADGIRLLNRFWEASPPDLVESAVDNLASFMLNPGSYQEVLRGLQDKADAEWAVWRNDA